MISSIKRFLLVNLLLSIAIISILALIGNFLLIRHDIRDHFDTHLIDSTQLLWSVQSVCPKFLPCYKQNLIRNKVRSEMSSKVPYQFKIWNKQGKLILRSEHIFNTSLGPNKLGFHNLKINEHNWRFYTKKFTYPQITIQVGQARALQKKLEKRIVLNYLEILIIIVCQPKLNL
jgi:two-component system sensor histidine kinase QseC